MTFFFSPQSSLHQVHCLINQFSKISVYTINWSKSEILPQHGTYWNAEVWNTPFKVTSQIKYLGIQLTSNSKDLMALNFTPLLKNIEDDLARWNKLPLSLIGWIAAIKMSVLPKLIYLFQMIPVTPHKKWFNKLDSLVTTFYWKQKKTEPNYPLYNPQSH